VGSKQAQTSRRPLPPRSAGGARMSTCRWRWGSLTVIPPSAGGAMSEYLLMRERLGPPTFRPPAIDDDPCDESGLLAEGGGTLHHLRATDAQDRCDRRTGPRL
jgi:hypothetical protein